MYPVVIATLLNSDIGRLETIIVLVCQDTDQFSIQSSESLCVQLLKEASALAAVEASTYEANHSRMDSERSKDHQKWSLP